MHPGSGRSTRRTYRHCNPGRSKTIDLPWFGSNLSALLCPCVGKKHRLDLASFISMVTYSEVTDHRHDMHWHSCSHVRHDNSSHI
jgi:hypothetical protein